jgi:hypothetical protein
MLKLALSDAVSLAATLLAYHRSTEGLEPNAEWVAKLDGASDKFRELGRKAATAFGGGSAATDAQADASGAAASAEGGAVDQPTAPPALPPVDPAV